MVLRRLLLLTLFVAGIALHAQKTDNAEDGNEILVDLEDDGPAPINGYRHQINIEVSAPHNFYNKANAMAFNGIVQANIWYSVKVVKGFSMGPYFRYTGFEFYAGRINQSNPLVTHLSAGLQMSYEVRMGERFVYLPSLFLGAGYVQYDNLSLPPKGVDDKPRNRWTDWDFAVQTNQSFYYYVKQNRKIAVGLILGLQFNTHEYSLQQTGLTADASLNAYSDNGPTLIGNVGFGLLMNFGKIKRKNQ